MKPNEFVAEYSFDSLYLTFCVLIEAIEQMLAGKSPMQLRGTG